MLLLNDMSLFVEVVKARSFRKAAEIMEIPSSTLSRRISVLEKAIGLRLLNRTTRKVELTEAGQIYFERSKRIVDEARLAHEQLGEMLAQPSGMLRVSLPVDFAINYLATFIAEFSRQYPGITFDFDLTPRRVDLVSEPFDIAIRMGIPEDSQLIARPLARLSTALYASPAYLDNSGEPDIPEDLQQHECLGMAKSNLWTLHKDNTIESVSVGGRYILNNVGMIRRLTTLGMGVSLLPEEIAHDDVVEGRLRRILPQWKGEAIPVYALTETRLLPAKTQRFLEFLRDNFKK